MATRLRGAVYIALGAVVPSWLRMLSNGIISTARNFSQGKAFAASRRFFYRISKGSRTFGSNVYCTGKYVQISAWDNTFKVPPGGFRLGDIDPMTGEPFPGAVTGRGGHILLVDKPEVSGEPVKAVARTYSSDKYSGRTITKLGFFDHAIRKNVGMDNIASPRGKANLRALGLDAGKAIGETVAREIVLAFSSKGLGAGITGPFVVTIVRGKSGMPFTTG